MKKNNIVELLIYIISAETAGVLSALFSGGFEGFYDKYIKPPLLPPSRVFPVVWVILYALMGISAYLIKASNADDKAKNQALTIYWAQLAVNFLWSIVFFRFEWIWGAAAVVIILLVLIFVMILKFLKIRPAAGYLNIPYLLWTAFASYLTIAVAVLN